MRDTGILKRTCFVRRSMSLQVKRTRKKGREKKQTCRRKVANDDKVGDKGIDICERHVEDDAKKETRAKTRRGGEMKYVMWRRRYAVRRLTSSFSREKGMSWSTTPNVPLATTSPSSSLDCKHTNTRTQTQTHEHKHKHGTYATNTR